MYKVIRRGTHIVLLENIVTGHKVSIAFHDGETKRAHHKTEMDAFITALQATTSQARQSHQKV